MLWAKAWRLLWDVNSTAKALKRFLPRFSSPFGMLGFRRGASRIKSPKCRLQRGTRGRSRWKRVQVFFSSAIVNEIILFTRDAAESHFFSHTVADLWLQRFALSWSMPHWREELSGKSSATTWDWLRWMRARGGRFETGALGFRTTEAGFWRGLWEYPKKTRLLI